MAGATPRQSILLNTSGEYVRNVTLAPAIIKNQHPLGTIYQAPNNCMAAFMPCHGPLGKNIVNGTYGWQHYVGNDFTKVNTSFGSASVTTYYLNDNAVTIANTPVWLGGLTPFTLVASIYIPTTKSGGFSFCTTNSSNGEVNFYVAPTSDNTLYAVVWYGSGESTTALGTLPNGNVLVSIEVTYVTTDTYNLKAYANGKYIGSSDVIWRFNAYSALGPRHYAYPNHPLANTGLVYGLWIMKGRVGAVSTAEPWSQTLSYKTKANNNWVAWG